MSYPEDYEKSKPVVEVLVGMVASGKSNYALKRAREGALVVSEDATVLMVHGGDYNLYDVALKPVYKAIEIQTVLSGIAMGRDIIIDRVNGTQKTRARWVAIANSLDVDCWAVIFPMDLASVHADRRVAADTRGYSRETWLRVIKKHMDEFEEVRGSEKFHKLEYR